MLLRSNHEKGTLDEDSREDLCYRRDQNMSSGASMRLDRVAGGGRGERGCSRWRRLV